MRKLTLPGTARINGRPEMTTLLQVGSDHPAVPQSGCEIRGGRFQDGLSAGVEILELVNGPLRIDILPTRGMGIWKARLGDMTVGWNSPVAGPVHPSFVNLQSRNRLGWLDGFDELLVRCGLSFNGPPGEDHGAASPIESDLTLHGRIANIPARDVELFFDEETSLLGVSGIVDECTLFGPRLQLRTTILTRVGSREFTIRDEVMNPGSAPAEIQLLNHINIGRPFLESGATLDHASRQVVPRDARAAEGMADYSCCAGPTDGFAEQVYYFEPLSDADGQACVQLKNSAADRGISVSFDPRQLPCFSFWKCTQAESAGYVAGLEPGTNFPNFKSFEREQGRVLLLPPGESRLSEVTISIQETAEQVGQVSDRIARLQQQSGPTTVHDRPLQPFCNVPATTSPS